SPPPRRSMERPRLLSRVKAPVLDLPRGGPIVHRMKALRAFLLPLLACSLAAAEDKGMPREWTSTEGQKISGLMLGTEGDAVALKLANGKVSKVPLARLSEADREFVAA